MAKLDNLEWETRAGHPGTLVAGCDEVGRGCLAGPVVAAAVLLPAEISLTSDPWLAEITDSKKLTPKARERLVPRIESWAQAWALGSASVEEIDAINIYHASHLAMKRALEKLKPQADHVLIDGNAIPKGLRMKTTAIVKGDLLCLSIAAASILAKVWRDRHMAELDVRYPGYGFGVHKGYATPAHSKALTELGCCAIHRRSFAPVAAALGLSKSGPLLASPAE